MSDHQTLLQFLPAGTLLDGIYEVEGLLGSGGFGKTYQVYDRQLNRQLAIKEYFPVEAATRTGLTVRPIAEANKDVFEKGLERFNLEARHLAKLQHRNVVKVFRSFDGNCTSYIVLEYVEGSDLEDWLAALARPLTQDELDKLSIPLLSALAAVHAAELVHRDIQPKNIRIRSRDGEPVLLDFGIAKSIAELDTRRQSTVIVAHGYAPPKSYTSGKKFQGPWTDIYGLAAVLYRALSGNPPPHSPDRLYEDHMVPAASLPLRGAYREGFLDAIDWGLALNRTERPQIVEEWRTALLEARTAAKKRKSRTTEPLPASAGTVPPETMPSKTGTDKGKISRTRLRIGVALTLSGAAMLGIALINSSKFQELIGIDREASAGKDAEAARQKQAEKQREADRISAEEAKLAKVAEDARKAADEARRAKVAEDARKAADEAKRAKVAEDARKAEDEARRAKVAEDARKAEDEARRAKVAEDARKAEDEARRAKVAEDARKAEDEARRAKVAEDARKAEDEARRAKVAEDARKAEDEAKEAEKEEKPRNAGNAKPAPERQRRVRRTGDGEEQKPRATRREGGGGSSSTMVGIGQ